MADIPPFPIFARAPHMDAESVREEIAVLLAQCHNAVTTQQIERESANLSAKVMEDAFPGEVISIESVRDANGRTACEFRKRTEITDHKFERAGFTITERGCAILDALKAV